MDGKVKYEIISKMWKSPGKGGWYFVAFSAEISKEIRAHFQWQEEGWGRMKISAQISDLQWKTSIWFDSKHELYVLPIKADIRKKFKLEDGDEVNVTVFV